MNSNFGRAVVGFIAAAIAVVTVHQGIIWLLPKTGLFPPPPVPVPPARPPAGPWSLEPYQWRLWSYPLFHVPRVVNAMFWGGLWGIVYGIVFARLPGPAVIKGLLFGLIGPLLIGVWAVLAYLNGRPYLGGFLEHRDVVRLLPGILIHGGFGIMTAIVFHMLYRK